MQLPQAVGDTLSGKRFALIRFNPAQARRISSALEEVSAFSRSLKLDPATPAPRELAPFDLAIVSVAEDAAQGEARTEALLGSGKPVLMIGSREQLLSHGQETMANSTQDFLVEPWEPEDLVLRSYRMLSVVAKPEREPGGGLKEAVAARTKVVVADDDPTTLALVSAVLRNHAIDCEIAHDGGQALELARRHHPAALVLDINMPRLDGFEVLASIRNDSEMRALPVVMLTTRQQETDVLKGFGLGADDYVVKPFNPLELVARLKRLLRSDN